jgi:hypothetical protein
MSVLISKHYTKKTGLLSAYPRDFNEKKGGKTMLTRLFLQLVFSSSDNSPFCIAQEPQEMFYFI